MKVFPSEVDDVYAQCAVLKADNKALREALEVAATAELYDPSTGIIDADVLKIVQDTARAALAQHGSAE